MYRVELYAQVRRSVFVEGLSERDAARRFGLARETVRKMLRYAVPPGYRRQQPVRRPKLDRFTGIIDQILEGEQKPTSPFTAKDGTAMIDGLFERAGHIPIWLLSLGNEVVTIGELEEKMKRLGRETKAIEIKYQHLPAVATAEKKQKNREFLVVGWDPAAALFHTKEIAS